MEIQLERIKKQTQELRQQLSLTPSVTPYFDDFVAKVNAYAADEFKRQTGSRAVSASFVSRLGATVTASSNRYAALEELHISTKRLYENLTDADRRILDQQALPILDAL